MVIGTFEPCTLQTWFWSHTGFHVRGIANWLLAIVFVGEIGSGAFGLYAYAFIRQRLVATEHVALFGEGLQHHVEELEQQLIALGPGRDQQQRRQSSR